MTTPSELNNLDRAGLNGEASLSERVKGLRLSNGDGAAKSGGGSGWLPWTLCLLMAITWASFAIRAYTTGGWQALIGRGGEQPAGAAAPTDGPKPAKSAPTAATAGGPDELVLDVKGNLIAARQIQVGPDRVVGRITKLNFVEGKPFKEGETLAEIDDTDYRADYRQMEAARAALAKQLAEMKAGARPQEKLAAKAQVDEAQALLDQYKADLARLMNLGIKSQQEIDLAKAKVDSQQARVEQMKQNYALVLEGPRQERIDAMQAQLDQATARAEQAKAMLDRCVIRAPVTGIVLSKRTEIGNIVNPLAMNANFNGGICEIADLTDLEVDLEVQERDIRKVRVGQACIVRADAYPERRYTAWVDRIMPVAKSAQAVIPVRVKVRMPRKEEGQYLRPQMGAVVWFYNRDADTKAEPQDPVIVE